MRKRFAELRKIDNQKVITMETHSAFLFQLQNSVLLALHERGRLSTMQYRHASEKLNQQRLARARKLLETGEK